MRFRRSFSRGRRRAPHHWIVPNIGWDGVSQQAIAANTNFIYQLGGAISEPQALSTTGFLVTRATLMRIRGTISLVNTDASASAIITYAMALYRIDAGLNNVATTLAPTNQTDMSRQDILWTASGFLGPQASIAAAGVGVTGLGSCNYVVDIKAKRVLEAGHQLQLAIVMSQAGQSLVNLRYLLARAG